MKKISQLSTVFFCLCLWVQAQETRFIGDKKVFYGAAYYPEAWDMKTVDEDIKRMKELHMNVVRMAEFSWVLMEPSEGQYDFKWLHNVVNKLNKNGISVILGTPTASPPVWMSVKYPEIYRIQEDGSHLSYGARRACSYTNAKYRELSGKICEKMAQEFAKEPGVIGWQTDNEFGLSPDYSNETKILWHKWLLKSYGTIDILNKLWCTQLWSQKYDDFEQVPMPVKSIWHNPSLVFNWNRFTNEMIVEYQDIQVNAIRKYSKAPVTHDGMPGQSLDYEKLYHNLDYMAVNNYHSFEAYDLIQSNYDRMRGYGKGFHWLFETAPNYSGGGNNGNTWFLHQPEGSMNAAIWMNHALGGQGTLFWLWRQHPAGQEMVHGSVISAWNKPAANYEDIKKLGADLEKASDFLMNAPVAPAEVAIFWCHQNLLGLSIEQYANGLSYYQDWTYRFYRPIADAYIHRDVIPQSADLSKYKLLFAPLMPYITADLRERLKKWVQMGGVLVLGPMSGYRNGEWAAFTDHAMGDLETWSGIEVASRIPVGTLRRPSEIPVMLNFADSLGIYTSEALLWSEALFSTNGRVLATYQRGMHNSLPAIIENRAGKGKVVVLGTDPGKDALKALAIKYAKEAGVKPIAIGDPGVVVAPRIGPVYKGVVVVNISREPKTITIPQQRMTDILTGSEESDILHLKPYEVKVLKIKQENKLNSRLPPD